MKNILVTGSKGQLGNELRVLAPLFPQFRFYFMDLDLDITQKDGLKTWMSVHPVDWVVNCAAYTAVDKAETDFDKAMLINGIAPGVLATVAKETGARLVHISTDYVFDGTSCKPYKETDWVNPRSKYGQSKLKGEQTVLDADPTAIVIRTSWLYSAYGQNFVKTMRKYGAERGHLRVVYDQVGGPTHAADLAAAILQIVNHHKADGGIYHYANEGVVSWFDFAQEVCRQSNIACTFEAIRSEEYPLPAPRPHYSVFDKQKIKTAFQITIPWWRDSLARCIPLLENS
jgi:dTDP-4-dehydrorhamnose reductase